MTIYKPLDQGYYENRYEVPDSISKLRLLPETFPPCPWLVDTMFKMFWKGHSCNLWWSQAVHYIVGLKNHYEYSIFRSEGLYSRKHYFPLYLETNLNTSSAQAAGGKGIKRTNIINIWYVYKNDI